jgi:hypothetical protein
MVNPTLPLVRYVSFLIIPDNTPSASHGVIPGLSVKKTLIRALKTVLFGVATYSSQTSMSTSPHYFEGACLTIDPCVDPT